MAFRRIKIISLLVLMLCTFSVEANVNVIDFYGKQYINYELGELFAVLVADTIKFDFPEPLKVEGLMGVTSLSYLSTQDGKIDFMITLAPKGERSFSLAQGYLYNESGKLLLKGTSPIHLTGGKDRVTLILQIPANLIKDGGKYYFQIYLPQKNTLELYMSWPILVGK